MIQPFFVPKQNAKKDSLQQRELLLAREILETSFISPQDVMERLDLVYSKEQLHDLAKRLPHKIHLEQFLAEGKILVCGPPAEMSLLDICNVYNDRHFDGREFDEVWYDGKPEQFARTNKVTPGWIALSRNPIEVTLDEKWHKQCTHFKEPVMIPNIAEFAWVVVTYRAITQNHLYTKRRVRTASIDSTGNCVIAGKFSKKGLVIEPGDDTAEEPDLGVAVCQKF